MKSSFLAAALLIIAPTATAQSLFGGVDMQEAYGVQRAHIEPNRPTPIPASANYPSDADSAIVGILVFTCAVWRYRRKWHYKNVRPS